MLDGYRAQHNRSRLSLALFIVAVLTASAAAFFAASAGAQPAAEPARPLTGQAPAGATATPNVVRDAFMELRPQGSAPPNGGTVTVGSRFVLEMWLNAGSNDNASVQQSYMTFTYQVLQNAAVGSIATGCVPTDTVTLDATTFGATLQNEVCNGPNPCIFRGSMVDPGSLAFASGSFSGCNGNPGCGGVFRVAQVGLCAVGAGQGILHWQFSPPAPTSRDSQILDPDNRPLEDPSRYVDYVINVTAGTPTNTPGPGTPSVTPTTTRTATGTLTVTETVNPLFTATRTPTVTRTPTATQRPVFTPTRAVTQSPVPTACAMGFTDVFITDYFYNAVRYLYCMGAITGYNDGSFRPYNNTTRGQLSKIIVLAEQWPVDTTGGPHFSDVPTDNAFYAFIETAYNRGIISGYSDGTFKWGNNVTRGQLTKIVVLAENWTLNTTGGPHFIDVPTTDPFYAFIETAYNRGIISGYSDGTFRPGYPATRGQISKIVYNALISP